MYEPDLNADLVCGESAAGILLGISIKEFIRKIGSYRICDKDVQIGVALRNNEGWILKESRNMFGKVSTNIYYKDRVIRFDFGSKGILFQISVGKGYDGAFEGVRVGDDPRKLEDRYLLEFESSEDAFLLSTFDREPLIGVGIITNHWVPFEVDPHQIIENIVIADYSLAK